MKELNKSSVKTIADSLSVVETVKRRMKARSNPLQPTSNSRSTNRSRVVHAVPATSLLERTMISLLGFVEKVPINHANVFNSSEKLLQLSN